jgi:hypothetical protein
VVCDRSDKSDQKMSLGLRSLKSLRSHSLTAESIVACSHVAFHVVPGEFDGDSAADAAREVVTSDLCHIGRTC